MEREHHNSPPTSSSSTSLSITSHSVIHFKPTFFQSTIIMQYFTIISALFAAAAIAQPTAGHSNVIATRGLSDLKDAAKGLLDNKADGGCEVLSKFPILHSNAQAFYLMKNLLTHDTECVAALAPASVTCAAALVEAGANPIADAACFATGLNLGLNPVSAKTF